MTTLVQSTNELDVAVERFERVLEAQISGREVAWTDQVVRALRRIEEELRLHMDKLEGRQGLFAALVKPKHDTLPGVTRQVGRLRRGHYDLLVGVQELMRLGEGVRNTALPPAQQQTWDFRAPPQLSARGLRARGRRLLEALEEHQRAEARLLQDKYVQDTGVGD
jgi:hypothetical protein